MGSFYFLSEGITIQLQDMSYNIGNCLPIDVLCGVDINNIISNLGHWCIYNHVYTSIWDCIILNCVIEFSSAADWPQRDWRLIGLQAAIRTNLPWGDFNFYASLCVHNVAKKASQACNKLCYIIIICLYPLLCALYVVPWWSPTSNAPPQYIYSVYPMSPSPSNHVLAPVAR